MSTGKAKNKALTTPNGDEDADQQELGSLLGNAWWYSHIGLESEVSHRTKHFLTLLPSNSFLQIYPNEAETQPQISSQIFTVASLIIAQSWRYTRCPWVGQWVTKPWCIWAMKYYSAQRKREVWIQETHGGSLDVTCWRKEANQKGFAGISTRWCSGKGKTMETVKWLVCFLLRRKAEGSAWSTGKLRSVVPQW